MENFFGSHESAITNKLHETFLRVQEFSYRKLTENVLKILNKTPEHLEELNAMLVESKSQSHHESERQSFTSTSNFTTG